MHVPLVCVEIPKNTSVLRFVPRYEAPLLLLVWRGADGFVTQYDHGNPVKIIPHPPGYHDKELFWRQIDSFEQEFGRLVKEYTDEHVRRLYPTQEKWEEACLRALKDADMIREAQSKAKKTAQRAYVADPDFEALVAENMDALAAMKLGPEQLETIAKNMDAVGIAGVDDITRTPLLKLAAVPDMPLDFAKWLKEQLPTVETAPDHEQRETVPLAYNAPPIA